jgi:hypothetical protein
VRTVFSSTIIDFCDLLCSEGSVSIIKPSVIYEIKICLMINKAFLVNETTKAWFMLADMCT